MNAAVAFLNLDDGEFSERRRIARQRGTPAWLWPEVSPADWARALADFRQAIAAILTGKKARLSATDPLTISLACYTSGVGPLLGLWCETGVLKASAEIKAILALHLKHGREREKRVRAQAQRMVSALTKRGIPVIILKGADTAYRYFPVPEARPAADLDLLVPFDWSHAAEAVLADQALIRVGRSARETTWADSRGSREPRSLWLVHCEDPWSIDLHSSLNFAASRGAAVVKLDAAKPFESPERWALDPSAQLLSQPLLLLHLAVHSSGGLHSLTLLRMVEIILVIRRDAASGQLSWDEFVALAARTNGLGAAFPALRMCELLAPGTVPAAVLDKSGKALPDRARAVVDKLEPSTAHRVDRASVSEHFMWVTGIGGWFRQLTSDLAPNAASLRRAWSIYEARAYRLLRGRITR
jgi:hypothetical protein